MANLITRVAERCQPGVATMVRTFYKQISLEEAHGQEDRAVAQLQVHSSRPLRSWQAPHQAYCPPPPCRFPLAENVVAQPAGATKLRDPSLHRRGSDRAQPDVDPAHGGAVLAERKNG